MICTKYLLLGASLLIIGVTNTGFSVENNTKTQTEGAAPRDKRNDQMKPPVDSDDIRVKYKRLCESLQHSITKANMPPDLDWDKLSIIVDKDPRGQKTVSIGRQFSLVVLIALCRIHKKLGAKTQRELHISDDDEEELSPEERNRLKKHLEAAFGSEAGKALFRFRGEEMENYFKEELGRDLRAKSNPKKYWLELLGASYPSHVVDGAKDLLRLAIEKGDVLKSSLGKEMFEQLTIIGRLIRDSGNNVRQEEFADIDGFRLYNAMFSVFSDITIHLIHLRSAK